MEFLVPRIPVHLLFSYISVVVTVGLMVLVLATPRRQATPSFIALAATMALWQFTKLVKNGGIPFLHVGHFHWWSTLSFLGATFIYPSLFILSLQLSGRRLRQWHWQIFFSIVSATILVALFAKGYLTDGMRLAQYGYYNNPKPLYSLYAILYTAYMVWGIILLWRKPPERHVMQYPSRILFWAATLGFGFGSLEFYSIMVEPLYPLADLSTAFYSGVFYWAIFRHNYMGGRALLWTVLLRLGLFAIAFAFIFFAFILLQELAPWFERTWVPAILIALISSAVIPFIFHAYAKLRQRLFPVQHTGRELLLGVSSLVSKSTDMVETAEQILSEVQHRFGYSRGMVVLFKTSRPSETLPHLICHDLTISSERICLLELDHLGAISRRELLDSIRQISPVTSPLRKIILRNWRLLRRCRADILISSASEEGLELVMLLEEHGYRTENWSVVAPLLEGVCKILADHLYLRRITETRVQERNLSDLGLMAAGLAHEIKNPLEGIYGAAQILQEEAKGNPRFVEMVLKDSVRLNDIVQSFLKFARPWTVHMQTLDLVEFLQGFTATQISQGLTVTWEKCSSTRIYSDPNGLQQILVNLVQNAERQQPQGTPVRINISEQGKSLELRIEDDGTGVAAEQVQHLFKPFFTTSAKGNGLGLALSRKISRAMGGDLYFVPSERGAIFALRILKAEEN